MSNQPPTTLGEKIDALLAPFVQDEAELQKHLEQLEAEAQRIQVESAQAREDLAVIQSAKVNALREAAGYDPLLRAVFAEGSAKNLESQEESPLEIVDEGGQGDGHPLLSQAS